MIELLVVVAASATYSWWPALEPVTHEPSWVRASGAYQACFVQVMERSHGQNPADIVATQKTACKVDRDALRQATIGGLRKHPAADPQMNSELVVDLLFRYLDASVYEVASQASGQVVPVRKGQ